VTYWRSPPRSAGSQSGFVRRGALTADVVIIDLVSEVAPALAKLEAEIGQVLDEHRDELVHRIATALVEIAVQERAARNGNGRVNAPKLCSICRA
jgi:hypothetical protein